MNQYKLTFSLSTKTKIIIPFQKSLPLISCCNAAPVLFLHNNTELTIGNGPAYCNLIDLREALQKTLNYDLQLPSSITLDVGYLYNRHNKNSQFRNEKSRVGKYSMWYAYKDEKIYVTWIYNDKNGNIIFEITPSYPYFDCDKKKEQHYVTFRQWIRHYKPYFIAHIPRETAQQWLEQADFIIENIRNNVARWEKEYEEYKKNKSLSQK